VKDEDHTLLIVSDGKTKWTYLPGRKQYTVEVGSGDEVVSAGGRKSVLPVYRSWFERFRNVSDDSATAVLESEDRLKVGTNVIACYVVKIPRQDGSVDELWTDEDRYIVWRSRHVSASVGEGTLPTITVNVLDAKLNTELGKSIFHFDPPDNTKRVRSFE
jgi:outer membrane lipoprotein-sorting protein